VAALPPAPELPGSTQSLPLAPLGGTSRALGGGAGGAGVQGLGRRDVRPFSLVGVVWDDPGAVLRGTVQVRTRATGGGTWSEWQDVETHNDEHGADPGTAEGAGRVLKGSTAPLWVGDSDGVEIRVRGEEKLPGGLRLELVDPGEAPETRAGTATDPGLDSGADSGADSGSAAPPRTRAGAASGPVSGSDSGARAGSASGSASGPSSGTGPGTDAAEMTEAAAEAARTAAETAREAAEGEWGTRLAPYGSAWVPALAKEAEAAGETEGVTAVAETAQSSVKQPAARPYIGPRPKIVTRQGWGADERIREKGFVYTKTIKVAFVHHSATGNNYSCSQAPAVLRGIYRYHVKSSGWRDIGYNFAVDKCGNIYEGRAGGVTKPVLGAHTLGFNVDSMGIAVLGTFGSSTPPAAAVTAVARLTAWKLGLHGIDPKGSTYLVSGGGNLYKKGTRVRFHTIAGHRDGFATECPGARLYGRLGSARTSSAKYQGRH
ncbi:peptidoglycan recognition protein, partial [Streptomyces sp. CBMA370]